jgi:hypothetical protein
MTAPKYSMSYENISHLRNGKLNNLKVGEVKKDPSAKDNIDELTIRASPWKSPYGSFSAYLKEALLTELSEAKIIKESADLTLSAYILKNDISAPITGKGTGTLEVKYQISKDNKVIYESIKNSTTTWESSFFGAQAIGEAAQNYPKVYQSNLNALFTDFAFINAIKGN